jgi:hypothetical protein
MFEPRDDTQARRLCRIYLKLFKAGPSGARVDDIDATGPADMVHRRGYGDADLVRRLLDDALFDRTGSTDEPLYMLPATMRRSMAREVAPGVTIRPTTTSPSTNCGLPRHTEKSRAGSDPTRAQTSPPASDPSSEQRTLRRRRLRGNPQHAMREACRRSRTSS